MTFEPSPGPEPSALLRQAPALVWVTDRDLRFLAVHAGSLLDAELAEGAVGRSLLDFVAPGYEDVYAHFKLAAGVVDELRAAAAGGEKVLRWFETEVTTASGKVIAVVRKQIYVRLKPKAR